MQHTTLFRIAAVGLLLQIVFPGRSAFAEDSGGLTVADYCTLSVAQLQQAVNTLERHDRVPTEQEVTDLCEQYGTTLHGYYTFRGAHTEEVDHYLEVHTEIKEEIERLIARIQEIVQSKEES